jgi:hypothetical protein
MEKNTLNVEMTDTEHYLDKVMQETIKVLWETGQKDALDEL